MAVMTETYPPIRVLQESLDRAVSRNQSVLHSFDDGIDKVQDNSIIREVKKERAFMLNLMITRQVSRTAATEKLRDGVIENLETIEESDDNDLRPSVIASVYNIIDDIKFFDLIAKRNRETVDTNYLMGLLQEEAGMRQEDIDTIITILSNPVTETDEYMRRNLTDLVSSIDDSLGDNPVDEDWNECFLAFNEFYVEMDSQIRFPGDVT